MVVSGEHIYILRWHRKDLMPSLAFGMCYYVLLKRGVDICAQGHREAYVDQLMAMRLRRGVAHPVNAYDAT